MSIWKKPALNMASIKFWFGGALTTILSLKKYACVPSKPDVCAVDKEEIVCPLDCGLCKEHTQHTCLVILEVTNGCNLKCPICFASASSGYKYHPDIETIRKMYQTALDSVGENVCIQISGGEPTTVMICQKLSEWEKRWALVTSKWIPMV